MEHQSSQIALSVAAVDGDTSANATTMAAYVARPSGDGPFPGVLLLQEALGVNAQIRGVADRFADRGFVTIALELFHRSSPGYEKTDLVMDEVMRMVKTLTSEGLIADCRAAFDWLSSRPNVQRDKIAALGFCMGGRAAFLANSELPLAAAVSFYGGGIAPALLDRVPKLSGPHLFFWGGQDKSIPADRRRAVADALHAAGKRFVDVEFSDATHAFFNEQISLYNPAAAHQSWALALAFLEETLGVSPTP